jgi:hypothetical protein
MKTAGEISPRVGCFQRSRASKADHVPALGFLLGLIRQPQLAARHRKAQIVLEHAALANLGTHLRFEEAVGVAAFGLGTVQRRVGMA